MAENGLGYNNLLYMAVLLAGISTRPDADVHVVLVEEPEAHLHPQLQDLLMRYLEREGHQNAHVQVIVTTHSPNFASSAGVDRMTVMSRPRQGGNIVARAPSQFGLSDHSRGHLARFLDVTKSALLFARGVVLVEGLAEQLVVPQLAEELGRPLAQYGVAVINVDGLAFGPFADLFGEDKLPYRCVVISDSDRRPEDELEENSDPSLSATARTLQAREGMNLLVRLSERTFEWDFVRDGNWEAALAALELVRPRVAQQLRQELSDATAEEQADALLASVDRVKGRFAQALALKMDEWRSARSASESAGSDAAQHAPTQSPPVVVVPQYLREAIEWVTDEPSSNA